MNDAINEYMGVLRYDPDYPEARASLEKAMRKSGSSDEAVSVCLKLVADKKKGG